MIDTSAWFDLSDDELRSRLTSRGYGPPLRDEFVDNRDDPQVAHTLTSIFSRD